MHKDKIAGILSSWDQILADSRVNIHSDFGEAKDVQDIVDLIGYLRLLAKSDNPLRERLDAHIADHSNPHDFTLNISAVVLFTTLYNEYTARYGAVMTMPEFIIAVIHVKRFATTEDVDNHTNLDDAANLSVVDYSIKSHDSSVTAHAELFRHKFPGIPLVTPPTISILPSIASDNTLSVSRDSDINVYDSDGRVRTIGPDTLAVDYMYGFPTLPVFDTNTNSILNSRNPPVSMTGLSVMAASNIPTLYTPTDDQQYILLMTDPVDSTHEFFLTESDTIPDGKSILVFHYFPMFTTKVRVDINGASESAYCDFDFGASSVVTVEDAFIGGKINASVVRLPNWWFRCMVIIDTPASGGVSFKFSTMSDTGAITYLGDGSPAGAFWQFQVSDGPFNVPVIFSESTPGVLAPTKLSKTVTTEYNQYSGVLDIKAVVPLSEVFDVNYAMVSMYDGSTPIVTICTDDLDTSRLLITTFNLVSDVLSSIRSSRYLESDPQQIKQAVLSYSYGHHSYGFTNEVPHTFDHYDITLNGPAVVTITEADRFLPSYFTELSGNSPFDRVSPTFIQMTQDDRDPIDSTYPLKFTPTDVLPKYLLPDKCTTLLLGYDTIRNIYLNGYISSFFYYPVFANTMNVEFLCNNYVS